MFFKEFDLASYRLRYHRQYVVFRDVKTGKKFFAYVHEIGDENWHVSVYDTNGRGETKYLELGTVEPKYHYIAAGLYHGLQKPKEVAYVKRRLVKTYHVGFAGGHFDYGFYGLSAIRINSQVPNVLEPCKVSVDKALETGQGALSKSMYLYNNNLFYLSNIVGFRKGKTFIVDPIFKSEIEDCLRGQECKVRH